MDLSEAADMTVRPQDIHDILKGETSCSVHLTKWTETILPINIY